MKLPSVTHGQTLFLVAIQARPRRGEEIRNLLQDFEVVNSSLAAFYQMAKRMENDGLVRGDYVTEKNAEGQIVKKRIYTITRKGAETLKKVLAFYEKLQALE